MTVKMKEDVDIEYKFSCSYSYNTIAIMAFTSIFVNSKYVECFSYHFIERIGKSFYLHFKVTLCACHYSDKMQYRQ